MTIDLYQTEKSGPCRSVRMVARALGIHLNLIEVNLQNGDHLKEEFLAINPQHCIPTLNDNGIILWESRAILTYLVNKYGATDSDSLYPKDPLKRAKIDQKLYFDMGTLNARFKGYYYEQLFQKLPADPAKYKKFLEAIGFFDTALEGQKYAAGDDLTIADFSIIATISNADVAGLSLDSFPNVKRWYAMCRDTIPGWDINAAGMEAYRPFIGQLKK